MNISGRTVLLTGATGGIGNAIARALTARGAQMILTGRRVDVLEGLAREVGGRTIAADLADRAGVLRLVDEAVDILVANAALPGTGLITDFSEEEIDRALDVNLRAPIILARHLIEPMRRRGAGHMVFVSSLAGMAPSAKSSLYCATKFGLRGFALSLREDLHGIGVGVSVVAPGFVREAGMFADSGVQLPRWPGLGSVSPQDVARAVVEAIEHDRGEVNVAPLTLRAGAALASVAPGIAAALGRRLGSEKIVSDLAVGQRDKR